MSRRFLGALSLSFFAVSIAACAGGTEAPGDLTGGDGAIDGSDETGGGDDSSIFDLDGSSETFTGCTKKTCADLGANCGPAADGCGGLLDCGTCTAPEICGGGGKANVCGTGCKGLTCTDLKATCGKQGDGCGNVIDCGTCTAPQTCGGGGVANTCGSPGGDAGACTKKTCTDYGANCGWVSDGCGGLIECGTCTSPAICGGGGKPNVCGAGTVTMCTPKTCADVGANCGPIGDGCGGIITSCGTCTAPAICGGGGKPSVCGGGTTSCVNLACKQTTCTGTATTSISGTVYDPAGKHPLPNVYVYVPNAATTAIPSGASCDKCSAALTGSPLVTTTTDVNGKFTLKNMPVDTNVPVVIQLGKWRRQITVTTSKCADTAVPATLTHFPTKKSEGDIPKIALTTGAADPLECLLRKIGIDDSEFTNPSGTGRVNLYEGMDPGSPYVPPTSAYASGGTFPNATTLWNTKAALMNYDVVLLGCEGADTTSNKNSGALQAMQDYVNSGGRVFAEHYHYTWMKSGPAPFPSMVNWNSTLEFFYSPTNETVLTGFPKGSTMSQWMKVVGAATTTTPSTFPVNGARHSVTKVNDTTNITDWVNAPSADVVTINAFTGKQTKTGTTYTNVVQYFSFNTPVGSAPDAACGRMVFSDIHVASGDSVGVNFPGGCTTTTMTPQELALEFMFFDLASAVCDESMPPPTCTKVTCASQGISCGPAPDGCGALQDCGSCTSPATCGGGGVAGTCGVPSCTKVSCASQGIECGPAGDGCGGKQDCGTCVAPATCGGVSPGKCGVPPACVPLTCAGKCGPQGDGCGGVLSCPPCDGGSCTPTTCAAFGAECGIIGDGCGNTIDCGKCAAPKTCGGGGTPYKCGGVM